MKNIFPLLLLTITLFACKQSKLEKILIPRALQNGESFDEFPKSNVQIFTISKVDSSENELTDNYQKCSIPYVYEQPTSYVHLW